MTQYNTNKEFIESALNTSTNERFEDLLLQYIDKSKHEKKEEEFKNQSKGELTEDQENELDILEEQMIFEAVKDLKENISATIVLDVLLEMKEISSSDQNIDVDKYLFLDGKDVELQSWVILAVEGNVLKITDIAKKIRNYLIDNVEGYKFITKSKDTLVLKLIEEIRQRSKGQTKSVLSNEKLQSKKYTGPRDAPETSEDVIDLLSEVDKIIKLFTNGAGTKWSSYNKGRGSFEKNPRIGGLRIKKSNISKIKTEEYIEILEDFPPSERYTEFPEPFIKLLKKHLTNLESKNTNENIQVGKPLKFEADILISKLDLKNLDRREKIYDFWEKTNKKYTNLKTAVDNFEAEFKDVVKTDNFKILKTGNELSKRKYNHGLKMLKFLAEPIEDRLNYIVTVKPQTLESTHPDSILVSAFESFVSPADMKKLQNQQSENQNPYDFGDSLDSDSGKDILEFEVDEGEVADKKVETQYGKEGEGNTNTASVSGEAAERMRAGINETTELSIFGQTMNKITHKKKVDPLFAYAFTKDSAKFKNLVLYKKDVNNLKEELSLMEDMSDVLNLNLTFEDKLLEFSEELESLASKTIEGDNTLFHLPLSKEIHGKDNTRYEVSQDGTNLNVRVETRVKTIREFLNLITQFTDFGFKDSRSKGKGGYNISSSGEAKGPTGQTSSYATKNRENMMGELNEAKESFIKLLDEIADFYVKPLSSINTPFNKKDSSDDFSLFSPQMEYMLMKDKSKVDIYFMMLNLEISGVEDVFRGNYQVMDKLTNLFRVIDKPSIYDNEDVLVEMLYNIKTQLKVIYGEMDKNNLTNLINIELGNYFYNVIKKTNNNNTKEMEIFEKPSVEWNKLYDESEIYPLSALLGFIERNKTSIISDIEGTKNKNIYKEFQKALGDLVMKITKSKEEINLLEAHDSIRKMLNKPVYYKHGKLDNFDHVDRALSIMKSHFNVDLTVLELESIVNEVDSMKSIGSKYGMSSEGVYFLKANFR